MMSIIIYFNIMMNTNVHERENLNIITGLNILLIGTVLVSLFANYNESLILDNKDSFWTKEEMNMIVLLNKIVLLGILIGYVYVNYSGLEVLREKKVNQQTYFDGILELIASFFPVVAALILIYVLSNNVGFDNTITAEGTEGEVA